MPIFLVVSLSPQATALDLAVQANIPAADRYQLQGERGWLIHFSGTTVELSNKLTIANRQNPEIPNLAGTAIVTLVSSYYGLGPTDMWEWIQTRVEK